MTTKDQGSVEIIQAPAFEDNYLYLIHDPKGQVTIAVDPGDSQVIEQELGRRNLALTHILLTHHHDDHIGGVRDLVSKHGCVTIGFSGDASRLPHLDHTVADGSSLQIGSLDIDVFHFIGHTTGHVAYYFRSLGAIFVGDVLFGMGCGRLFEGTPAQMYASLQRLRELPHDTKVYCAHEYTLTNGHFAVENFANNTDVCRRFDRVRELRRQNVPTVPLTLSEEVATNPFLLATNLAEFTKLREQRNVFKVKQD